MTLHRRPSPACAAAGAPPPYSSVCRSNRYDNTTKLSGLSVNNSPHPYCNLRFLRKLHRFVPRGRLGLDDCNTHGVPVTHRMLRQQVQHTLYLAGHCRCRRTWSQTSRARRARRCCTSRESVSQSKLAQHYSVYLINNTVWLPSVFRV